MTAEQRKVVTLGCINYKSVRRFDDVNGCTYPALSALPMQPAQYYFYLRRLCAAPHFLPFVRTFCQTKSYRCNANIPPVTNRIERVPHGRYRG